MTYWAFKHAGQRIMDLETASQYSFILAQFIKGGAEFNSQGGAAEDVTIEAPDDNTLEVTLAPPTPFFLGLTVLPTCFPRSAGTSSRSRAASSTGALTLSSTAVPEHTPNAPN